MEDNFPSVYPCQRNTKKKITPPQKKKTKRKQENKNKHKILVMLNEVCNKKKS